MRREVNSGRTDVLPRRGSRDDRELQLTRSGSQVNLSEEYRLRRAIRVVPIGAETLDDATHEFDVIVSEIEARIAREAQTGSISGTWPPTCLEERTCVACDFLAFCPRPAGRARTATREEIDPEEI
jgi:hypothetical protein